MVTDEQVRLLMSLLNQGIPQATAGAKAGMSERTARKYAHAGRLPSQSKVPHTWRTRPDPFAEVWLEVEALLQQDIGLQAKTIWTELTSAIQAALALGNCARCNGGYSHGVLDSDLNEKCSSHKHTTRASKLNRTLPTCGSCRSG